jgi:hypothetical protein
MWICATSTTRDTIHKEILKDLLHNVVLLVVRCATQVSAIDSCVRTVAGGLNVIDARPVPGDATGVCLSRRKTALWTRVLPGSVAMMPTLSIGVTDDGERGLLSITIHSQFASGQRFLYAWFASLTTCACQNGRQIVM